MADEYWRSSYHLTSDDSVSSFGGWDTKKQAVMECLLNIADNPAIDEAWVRDPGGEVRVTFTAKYVEGAWQ